MVVYLIVAILFLPLSLLILLYERQYFFAVLLLIYGVPYVITTLLLIKPIVTFIKIWRRDGHQAAQARVLSWHAEIQRSAPSEEQILSHTSVLQKLVSG